MEDRLNYNTARSGVVTANKHTLFHSKVMDLSEQGKIFSTTLPADKISVHFKCYLC